MILSVLAGVLSHIKVNKTHFWLPSQFLDSAKGEKTWQKDESQPGSILTARWLDALQVVAVVG